MPKGNFEFKYVAKDSYPKAGLVKATPKGEGVNLSYNRRLTEKEIAKHNLIDMNRKVGKLAMLREQAGKKQMQMAEECGIANKSLQRYEQFGVDQMTVGMAVKIAKYLKCDLNDLLGPGNSEADQG